MADHFYVYPAYVSSDATRSLGRRVPAAVAVGPVSLEQIVAAAKAIGFRAEAEPEKHYPARFFRYEGRVKVTKRSGTSKAAFLKRLAEELRKSGPAPRAG